MTPATAWRRVLRMVGDDEHRGALAIRTEGRLTPEDSEIRLTELGVEGVHGTTDLLVEMPAYEWIGGTLLRSPDRVWRWSEQGLLPDRPELWPGSRPCERQPVVSKAG
jgi:hypothetical protein